MTVAWLFAAGIACQPADPGTWVKLHPEIDLTSFDLAIAHAGDSVVLHGELAEGGYGGVRYDLTADVWSDLPENGLDQRSWHSSAIDAEIVTWANDAAAIYSPDSDSWTAMRPPVMTLPDSGTTPVGVAGQIVYFGGQIVDSDDPDAPFLSEGGQRYDRETDTWHRLPEEGAPSRRANGLVASLGERVLVYGGMTVADPDGAVDWYTGHANDPAEGLTFLDDGAIYDPREDAWQGIGTAPGEYRLTAHSEPGSRTWVWTGTELLLSFSNELWAFDPETDLWHPKADGPSCGNPAWTGLEMLCVGRDILYAYTPETDSWTSTPMARTPPGLRIWTGDALFIWEYGTREPRAWLYTPDLGG